MQDKKTTVSGLVMAVASAVALVYPDQTELINDIAAGVAIIAAALVAYFAADGKKKPNP
jgi:ABC-type transport system involved in cytochrome c biogenesis permease component